MMRLLFVCVLLILVVGCVRSPSSPYSECDKYQEESRKNRCYETVGAALNDSEVCDRLHGRGFSEEKDWCIHRVLQLELTNPLICDKVQGGLQVSRDICYGINAEKLNNHSLCSKIKSQARRDLCYKAVGSTLKDLSVCKLIQDEIDKQVCYAIAHKDLSLLANITDNGLKDQSYMEYGIYSNDVTVCDKVQNQHRKDYCYLSVGTALNDSGVCEKITKQHLKDKCYNAIT